MHGSAPGFRPPGLCAFAGEVWHLLAWRSPHPHAPVTVAASPHYWAQLDVPATVRSLLRDCPRFWSSSELHQTLRDKSEVVTKRKPSEDEWKALELAFTVVKHVKSNAIVFANALQTVGVGAGQMSRVDAARLAVSKAQLPLKGSCAASDAFFPFRDGLDEIAD